MNSPLPPEVADNPWRTFIENVIAGDNYFRASEYRELLADLDRGYAAQAQVESLTRDLAAARAEAEADKRRLDWLVNNRFRFAACGGKFFSIVGLDEIAQHDNARDAIDAALAALQERPSS